MKTIFAPGCGLKLYNNEASEQLMAYLKEAGITDTEHEICCRHDPAVDEGTHIINVCSGCDKRFSELYNNITTETLWEVLANRDDFPFPDYHGMTMTIHDACPTRKKVKVHKAIRLLLKKMNINIIEPALTGERAVCCGDSLHRQVPNEKVFGFMKKRADTMPCEDVVVYCTSCTKAMSIGGKVPHYLVDLLLGNKTVPGNTDPDVWHKALDDYIETH